MTAAEIMGVSTWFLCMVYSALCIGIPEIRASWKGSNKKIGLFGSIGFTIFFWGPALVFAGISLELLSDSYWFIGILLLVLGAIFGVVGFLIDISSDGST